MLKQSEYNTVAQLESKLLWALGCTWSPWGAGPVRVEKMTAGQPQGDMELCSAGGKFSVCVYGLWTKCTVNYVNLCFKSFQSRRS